MSKPETLAAADDPPRKVRRGRRWTLYLALAAGAAVFAFRQRAGTSTVRSLGDDEVAVVYDGLRGDVRVVEGPGKLVEFPVYDDVRVMRRSPVPMTFTGAERPSPFQVPTLHLRTSEGSPMRFEDFSLRYTLLPGGAEACLSDTHAILDRAARLVEVATRDVLAARFGEYTAEEVVRHDVLVEETQRCRDLLVEALAPHGLTIVEFGAPRPRFDPIYEDAVERRKVSIAEIERLRARKDGLPAELENQLAELEHEKQSRRDQLLMKSASQLAAAQRAALVARTDATLYAEDRRRRAAQERDALLQEAEIFAMQQATSAENRRAEVQRVAALGRTAVLEAWIERLSSLTFRVEAPRPADDAVGSRGVAQRR